MRWVDLRALLARLLRRRALRRHYRKPVTLESLAASGVETGATPTQTQALLTASRSEPAALLAALHSSPQGLSAARAAAVRRSVGPNAVDHEPPLPWWRHLWQCYRNPFSLLLTVLATISWLTGDRRAAVVIAAMVTLSTALRFWQEFRSGRAADRLKSLVSNTATVLRPAAPLAELPIVQLVPGDVVRLSAGDMIPADLRVLAATDLFVNQSAMTGESLPVEKFPQERDPATTNPLDLDNLLFMGTNVVSGSATAVVVATGARTYFGTLSLRAGAAEPATSAFQAGVNHVSVLLLRFMLVMVPLVLLINGLTKGNWLEAALFALSVAVGLTPEMLPMIVTSTLAKGAVMLSRKKVVVKRLDAIQNLGAMDVLCTDKTGTLTQDRIALKLHLDAFGNESEEVLRMAFLNSHYQTGLKNLLDVAVLAHVELHKEMDVAANYRLIDEVPFDFQRRRMSVVVAEREHHHELICKGAVEEVLAVCTQVQRGDATLPMTTGLLAEMTAGFETLNAQGLRVVAVAMKELPPEQVHYGVADESGLTLLGCIAFLDPPKESTAPALAALRDHGIAVKILTGDNEAVTRKVCADVGLPVDRVLLGSQIEAMSDEQLGQAVADVSLFAKLSPAHKERIVNRLRANGRVVGYMGDGINDAAALRAADVGISVDTGVDIAKEAADIILLEKSLLVLDEGVIEGRRTFVNMLKYIRMASSSNFGNVLSVLVASALLPFLPMLPMHLLVQNLLYDVSQVAIPFDRVDDEQLSQPQQWRPAELGRFMLFFGPISSVFDFCTFAVMWFVFNARTLDQQTLFQSGWFVEGLLTQTLVVHLIRTRRLPFVQSRPAAALVGTTAALFVVGIWLPMGPLAPALKLQALPLAYFPYLAAILLGYALLAQAMKNLYAARYDWR